MKDYRAMDAQQMSAQLLEMAELAPTPDLQECYQRAAALLDHPAQGKNTELQALAAWEPGQSRHAPGRSAGDSGQPSPSVREYIENYRFEFDGGGSYAPTERDRAMLEDALEGYLALQPEAPAPGPNLSDAIEDIICGGNCMHSEICDGTETTWCGQRTDELLKLFNAQFSGRSGQTGADKFDYDLVREALVNAKSSLTAFGGDPRKYVADDGSIQGDEIQAAVLDGVDAALRELDAQATRHIPGGVETKEGSNG